MAEPGSATCPADVRMTSARGLPNADVIIAFDDVSVDLVNIDQVNRSSGSTSRWGPHVSGTVSLTSGSRLSGPVKGKKERKAEAVLGSKRRGPARFSPRNGGSAWRPGRSARAAALWVNLAQLKETATAWRAARGLGWLGFAA